MRLLLSFPLILAGLCGIVISLLGSVSVDFPLMHVSGLELSAYTGILSIIILLTGLRTLFLTE